MKTCKQCKRQLDLFHFLKDGKEYRMCHKCREYIKAYNKRDPEKTKNNQKQYRENNPLKIKQSQATHRKNNAETIRERDKLAKRRYRAENPEEYLEYRLEYQEKNKDKSKKRDSDRMLNRPEYFLFSSARKRARERNIEFDITEQDVKELLDGTPLCPLRQVKFERGTDGKATDNSASLDRIDSSRGYVNGNIQIMSYRANIIKNNIDLATFRKIVKNFEDFKLEVHDTDDNTRNLIIADRAQQIERENYSAKKISRLMNIETGLLGSARKRAKSSNLEFDGDKDYIKSIWPLDNKCPIMNENFVFGKNLVADLSATIDRIDNCKGYIKGNIRIISAKANSVKNKATLEELKFMLKNWEMLENKGNKINDE